MCHTSLLRCGTVAPRGVGDSLDEWWSLNPLAPRGLGDSLDEWWFLNPLAPRGVGDSLDEWWSLNPLQLSESHHRVAELETEVARLCSQLEEGKRRQQSLTEALATTRHAMELYQKTAQQDVSLH